MKKLILTTLLFAAIVTVYAFKTADEKVTIIVSHVVKDFSSWKKGFDADEVNRKAAGISVVAVYASTENPNEATIVLEAPSLAVAKGMIASPELKVAMEKAGVISKPEAKILYKK